MGGSEKWRLPCLNSCLYVYAKLRYNMTMENLKQLLTDNLNIDFINATLSAPRKTGTISKVKVRPILKKGTLFFQLETFQNQQAFHENISPAEAIDRLCGYMEHMKQMQLETKHNICSVLISKKGKVTIKKKPQTNPKQEAAMSHDRTKQYLLKEGIPIPFLVDLGVMTTDGSIIRSKSDKFRQINRFLEFIDDILPKLAKDRELTILDFGCGKSYLTFAMYYYMHEQKGYDVRIIGLDLKTDVIQHCNALSNAYGYQKLTFLEGDISQYTGVETVDMVVTLHACDTATDYALAKAIDWNATVILSVPCCQHELNSQIQNDILEPILQYGLIKERIASLITDAMRAQYLEQAGYDTQILEFIDMEHTPKNILLRGVKVRQKRSPGKAATACEEFLHISPTLGRLLEQKEDNIDEKTTD